MSNSTRGTKLRRNRNWQPLYNFPTENIYQSRHQNCDSSGTNGILAPRYALGMRVEGPTGEVYRFIENDSSTAFAEGTVLSQKTVTTITSATTDATGMIITGTFTSTTYADEWAGGYATIRAGTGKGPSVKIEFNDAVTAAASGTMTLDRSIGASLSGLTIAIRHPWRMQLTPAVITNKVHGVSIGVVSAQSATGGMYNTTGGISYFGWAQTAGICPRVLITATSPIASALSGLLTTSASVAGSADPIANGAPTLDDVWVMGCCEGTVTTAADYDTGALVRLLNME